MVVHDRIMTTLLEPCVYAVSYIFQMLSSMNVCVSACVCEYLFQWIKNVKTHAPNFSASASKKKHEPIHGNKLLIHSRYETVCMCVCVCICLWFFFERVCVCLFSWLLFSRLVPTIFHDFCIAFFPRHNPLAHTHIYFFCCSPSMISVFRHLVGISFFSCALPNFFFSMQ